MRVLKFGGSSLSSPSRMRSVANIVNNVNDKVIVVLSAIGDTTNLLMEIASKKDLHALEIFNKQNKEYAKSLLVNEGAVEEASNFVDNQCDVIRGLLSGNNVSSQEQNEIVSVGENISTKFFHLYSREQAVDSTLLSALNVIRLNDQGDPDLSFVKSNLTSIIEQNNEIVRFIIQGYVCSDNQGSITNLDRGGSDYTATILGAVTKAECIEIWTDIDGMHNNDPRIIENTKSIDNITYAEAEELAYFGAKILHPTCVWPAKKNNVPIVLKNTMCPEKKGTVISADVARRKVTAIAAKDGITSINIHSGRMLNAYGFLSRVFEIFEKYKTPVDMITTSEVSVALTIDNSLFLSRISNELSLIGDVKIESNQSIVCVVGNFTGEQYGGAKNIFQSLESIPVKAISYGSSENNVSLLVDTTEKKRALEALHTGLFAN